jgi:hypothetical protein
MGKALTAQIFAERIENKHAPYTEPRQTIKDIGGTMPEHLPPAEDIAKVGRRLKKTIGNAPKKLK